MRFSLFASDFHCHLSFDVFIFINKHNTDVPGQYPTHARAHTATTTDLFRFVTRTFSNLWDHTCLNRKSQFLVFSPLINHPLVCSLICDTPEHTSIHVLIHIPTYLEKHARKHTPPTHNKFCIPTCPPYSNTIEWSNDCDDRQN